jgi:hypothetical protein
MYSYDAVTGYRYIHFANKPTLLQLTPPDLTTPSQLDPQALGRILPKHWQLLAPIVLTGAM